MNPERPSGNFNEAGARNGMFPYHAGAMPMASSFPGSNYPALTSQTNYYIQSLNGNLNMFPGQEFLQSARVAVERAGGQVLVPEVGGLVQLPNGPMHRLEASPPPVMAIAAAGAKESVDDKFEFELQQPPPPTEKRRGKKATGKAVPPPIFSPAPENDDVVMENEGYTLRTPAPRATSTRRAKRAEK